MKRVPIAYCNVVSDRAPFPSDRVFEVLSIIPKEIGRVLIVRDTETNLIYEEDFDLIQNLEVVDTEKQFDNYRVSIKERYLERFRETEYKVVGSLTDGRLKLEDHNRNVIFAYPSRLIFEEYV